MNDDGRRAERKEQQEHRKRESKSVQQPALYFGVVVKKPITLSPMVSGTVHALNRVRFEFDNRWTGDSKKPLKDTGLVV